MPLIQVQDDAEYIPVRRRGRFAVPGELAESPGHLEACFQAMQAKMLHGMALHNYHWNPKYPFERSEPMEHFDYCETVVSDPGPALQPKNPMDQDAMVRWERAEKARLHAMEHPPTDLVDFRLIGTFWRKLPVSFHLAGAHAHTR